MKTMNAKHCFSIWQTLDERFQTFRPPLPPKGNQPAPVAPPRRNKKDLRSSTPSPEIPRMIQEINHMTQVFPNFDFTSLFSLLISSSHSLVRRKEVKKLWASSNWQMGLRIHTFACIAFICLILCVKLKFAHVI
jgi:hypothetical protein